MPALLLHVPPNVPRVESVDIAASMRDGMQVLLAMAAALAPEGCASADRRARPLAQDVPERSPVA